MPLVNVSIQKGKTEEYKKSLLDGVHKALVEAIKIPDWDRFQKLIEYEKSNFKSRKNITTM